MAILKPVTESRLLASLTLLPGTAFDGDVPDLSLSESQHTIITNLEARQMYVFKTNHADLKLAVCQRWCGDSLICWKRLSDLVVRTYIDDDGTYEDGARG